MGASHVAAFAFWLDPQYESMHGPAPLAAFRRAAESVSFGRQSGARRLR